MHPIRVHTGSGDQNARVKKARRAMRTIAWKKVADYVGLVSVLVIGTGRLLAWFGEQVMRIGHLVVRAGYRVSDG